MANKKYNVTQHINLNGTKKTVSFGFIGEVAELQAFLALIEGGYTVTEQNDTLSDITHSDTLVSEYNRSPRISMSAQTDDGSYVNANVKPYQGSIYFKNTTSVDDVKAVVATMHPWSYIPTLTPSTVSVQFLDDVAAATVV